MIGNRVSMLRLDRQREVLREELDSRIAEVMRHGRFIDGPEVRELEVQVSTYVGGGTQTVSCANGTDALVLVLRACNVGPGDAVFVPSLTFIASASAIKLVGASPVFVDVDPNTLTLAPADLIDKIGHTLSDGKLHPKAVIAVDLFGAPADYIALNRLCEEFGLALVGDAAQSFGAVQAGKRVGELAHVTCLSFYPSKGLGCYGDGGAVVVRDDDLLEVVRSLRWHGTDESRGRCERIGLNSRLDSLQAAVLLAKLNVFAHESERRQEVAQRYMQALPSGYRVQEMAAQGMSSYSYFCVITENADEMQKQMGHYSIDSIRYYSTPLHDMPAFFGSDGADSLPVTSALSRQILALPIDGYINDVELDHVCEALGSLV